MKEITNELQQLFELNKSGAISDEEYAAMKSKLLDKYVSDNSSVLDQAKVNMPAPAEEQPRQNMQVNVQSQPQPIIVNSKSVGVAFILTFFFGPLGMLYSTVTGAIVMLIVSFFAGLFTLGVGLLFTWPICIIWGCIAASDSNNKVIRM